MLSFTPRLFILSQKLHIYNMALCIIHNGILEIIFFKSKLSFFKEAVFNSMKSDTKTEPESFLITEHFIVCSHS